MARPASASVIRLFAGLFVFGLLLQNSITTTAYELTYDGPGECCDSWVKDLGCGCADAAAECGEMCSADDCCFTFDGSFVQIYQGVVDGGNRQTWVYGGSGRYGLTFDLSQVHDGLSMRIVGDHHVGEFIQTEAGVILPPGLAAVTPVDDTNSLIITNLFFSQIMNDNVTFVAGKMDTLDGDMNPFASGRGRTGFMNTAMLLPINGVPTVPFSTLGAGAIFSMDGQPFASLLALNATDTTTTSGLSELYEDGVCILGAVNLPFSLNDQLGLQTFSFAYNTKDFVALGQDPRVILPQVPITPTSGGWVAWWSGTQYIQQFDPKNDPMKGWGVFARLGVSDNEVNPITYWATLGLGGNSCICGRGDDRWGVGWYHGSFSNNLGPIATAALNVGAQTNAVEMFYNFKVTEHFYLTPDTQVIWPGRNNIDPAWVLGIRGEIRL